MNPVFKKFFELFIVLFILILIVYFLGYIYFFDKLCNKYSGDNEKNYIIAINKLAICKDSFICEAIHIETNNKNEINNWSCEKKNVGHLSNNIFNIFKDSIIK